MVGYLSATHPGLEVVQGDAVKLRALLAERGIEQADAVVSGLPWALFDEADAGLDPRPGRFGDRAGRRVRHLRATGTAWRWRRRGGSAGRCTRPSTRWWSPRRCGATCRRRSSTSAGVRAPRDRRRGPRAAARDRAPGRPPALPVLAAEPLYLLVDTAVVGRLGAVPLAGLAVAAVLFAQVTGQLNFLSYGTTARAARLHGAGRRAAAVGEGVQATWLALAVGAAGARASGSSSPVRWRGLLGDGGAVAAAAESWLRVALFGAPLVLVTLAGNGWMRGVQDTARPLRYVLAGNGLSAVVCAPLVHGLGAVTGLGLVGSAVANVVGQAVGAGLFLLALTASGPSLRPTSRCRCVRVPALLRAQLVDGPRPARPEPGLPGVLPVRGRGGRPVRAPRRSAAHQVVLQLWLFRRWCSTRGHRRAVARRGRAGRRRRAAGPGAGPAGRRLRAGAGTAFGVLFAALAGVLPRVFTPDPPCSRRCRRPGGSSSGMQPLAGVVFALDGVLLGAGDAAYLRTWTLVAPRAASCRWSGRRWRSAGGWSASGRACCSSSCCAWWRCCCGCAPAAGRWRGRSAPDLGRSGRMPAWKTGPASWSSTSLPG